MKLTKSQKRILQDFRDVLKKAAITIDAKEITLHTNEGVVQMDWLMTQSDYGENYELSFGKKTIISSSYQEFRTSTKRNRIIEE